MTDLIVQPGLVIPESELTFTTSRSGGPGGQHVNRTESRVTLTWDVRVSTALSDAQRERVLERLAHRLIDGGVIQLHADGHRSQLRNRNEVRERLATLLRGALHVQRKRKPTRPSRGAIERRIAEKRVRSAVKKQRRGGTDD